MEGGGGSFGYENIQRNPLSYPVSHLSQQQTNQDYMSANGFCDLSSYITGPVGSYAGEVPWQCPPQRSFVDQLPLGGQPRNWTGEKNPVVGFKEANLTDTHLEVQERSRKMVILAKGNGQKKKTDTQWTSISEKMTSRSPKQCRDRWLNHLLPGIKKGIWTEEEEKKLIEAHEQVGNQWVEIAKRIPGITENSVKNHWNATMRRQTSGKGKKPSILEDCIRKVHPIATTTTGCGNSSNQLAVPLPEPPEFSIEDYDFTTLTFDDELNFMQSFFGNTYNNQPSNDNNNVMGAMGANTFCDHLANNSSAISPIRVSQNNGDQLLNEIDQTSLYLNTQMEDMEYLCDTMKMDSSEATSNGKKDMDLMEMMAHFKFSQGSNTTSDDGF